MTDLAAGQPLVQREGLQRTHTAGLCEHAFVSIKGSSYARFLRALDAGDLAAVRVAALELPYVNLADALAICLLMRSRGDQHFERAAVRWLARLSLERPEISLRDLRDAAAALIDLPSPQARAQLAGLGARLNVSGIRRVLS
jgi:hypothetical protein